MHSYAVFVGHHTAISTAELSALLPDFTPGQWFGTWEAFTFQTSQELDQEFLDKLGGTMILAKDIIGSAAVGLEDIPVILEKELEKAKGKVSFGLRFIGVGRSQAREMYRTCKNLLKQRGRSSRYIGNEMSPAKPIQLHDEGLLNPKDGCEIVILRDDTHLWIGRTVGAQNVKAYTKRDIDKPVRDMTVGILPPKLAQILLNFGEYLITQTKNPSTALRASQKPKTKNLRLTVLDPFCGTGVIPIEAMLRGAHVLASDMSVKAVTGCTKNVEWTRKTFEVLKKDVEVTVWKQDATKPFELKQLPDVIVTEGSLGPALKSKPGLRDAQSMMRDELELIEGFLKNASQTLAGVPIAMTWPVWYAQKQPVIIEKLPDIVAKYEYRMILPPHVEPTMEKRLSLLYRRRDQFVGRELVMLMPKGPVKM